MIDIPTTLEGLLKHPDTEKTIKETLDDRLVYKDGIEILSNSQLYKLIEGTTEVGFYTVDCGQDSEEIHVYMYPEYRRYSLRALRYIKSKQTTTITTSVYGTHFHVCKFLLRIGFSVTGIKLNALTKNGEQHHVWELSCSKEKNNG